MRKWPKIKIKSNINSQEEQRKQRQLKQAPEARRPIVGEEFLDRSASTFQWSLSLCVSKSDYQRGAEPVGK